MYEYDTRLTQNHWSSSGGMSVVHRMMRHAIRPTASNAASAMSSLATPLRTRSVSGESPSCGGGSPLAANSTLSWICVARMSMPIAKHPALTVRHTASFTDPSYASRSYALAASAPGIHAHDSFAPCDSAGAKYGSDRHFGIHGAGTSHDGRGTPSANTHVATNTGIVVTTSASAMGSPLSSIRASVNRLRIVSPNITPFLNSRNRSTFVSTTLASSSFSTPVLLFRFVFVTVAREDASETGSSGPSPAARVAAERAPRPETTHDSRPTRDVSRSTRRDDAEVEVEAVRALAERRGAALAAHVAGARTDASRVDISVSAEVPAARGTAPRWR